MTEAPWGNRPATLDRMQVTVRLFAALREQAGARERVVELSDGATVADVWPALALGAEPAGIVYAVNRAYAVATDPLSDRDEVAVIPPVSGGDFRLSATVLSVEAAIREVASDDSGAIATFVGTTRGRSRGRDVVRLEYEAYEGMAEIEMERIAAELTGRYDLTAVAIHHRVGVVGIGETSVVIAVSAPHRRDALAACADAIDTLKLTVPLWKKEIYVGGEVWVGSEAQYQEEVAEES
jgi:molybdopterin synthase catalytic subunit/molybdopterin converting factor small subunit